MAEIKFSQLTTAAQLTNDDIFALAQLQGGSLSSVKTSMIAVANFLNTQVQYTTAYNTQAKTTAGAINELKQLISLIPQFSIEVVEELPTEDISDTTIYLVPAEDPEVGNYYEEYIHVNNTWELVGTTAVDLSTYYTKLEVDGLLATKASVTEVALKENKSDMPTDVRTIIKDCKTPKSATITNGIAQFECIEENLVKGLKVTMNPIQDLHGYSNPWAGGAGKNKLKKNMTSATVSGGITYTVNDDGTVTVSGTATEESVRVANFSLKAGSYIYNSSVSETLNTFDSCLSVSGKTVARGIDGYGSFTLDEDSTVVLGIRVRSGQSPNVTYKPMVRLSTETDATFVPYSNICPISGRTEASVTRTGANQWDEEWEQGAYNSSGEKVAWSGAIRGKNNISVFPNSQYYIKFSGTTAFYIYWYNDNSFIERISISSSGVVTPPANATKMAICTHNDYGTTYNNNISVNYPSTDTAYHAYTAETHTHQYGQTVYGGEDDFVNGGLSVEWGYIASYDGETLPGEWLSDRDVYAPDTTPTTGAEVAYKLSTPTTIQTSAEDITTVSGTNIISGTEPISECKYTELATVDDLRKIIGGQ